MNPPPEPSRDLVPVTENPPSSFCSQLPSILSRAGSAAVFAAEEFFYGRIRNEHTRTAYLIAVKRFLTWAEKRGLELVRIAPKDVGNYLDGLKKQNTSVATRKQHLAALRHFFDGLVTRHAIVLNPALSVRGERYEVVEGKTPEITVKGAMRPASRPKSVATVPGDRHHNVLTKRRQARSRPANGRARIGPHDRPLRPPQRLRRAR